MPEFLVLFERQVYEHGGTFVMAEDEQHAKEMAAAILRGSHGLTVPWHRGDVVNDSEEVRRVDEVRR